jgi:hypothetical protein
MVQALLLTVLVRVVVLLPILHETPLSAERRADALLEEPHDRGLPARSRLELLDDLLTRLAAMFAFRVILRSGLMRLAVSHLLSVV